MSSVSDILQWLPTHTLEAFLILLAFTSAADLTWRAGGLLKLIMRWWTLGRSSRHEGRGRSLVLDLLLPMKIAQDAQANLEEVTPIWIASHGPKWAKIIRASQVVRIVVGHHIAPLVGLTERLLKIVRG